MKATQQKGYGGMKSRILLVDDHLNDVGFVLSHLTNAGYDVETAQSGSAALIVCENTNFDIILLDMHMPGKSGIEVCKALRATERHSKTPVIFLTADVREESEVAGLTAGGDEYVTKPFSVLALETRIAKLIRNRTCQRRLSHRLREWRSKAATDELTGLRRREHIDNLPADMRGRGIAMLDVDRFKSVNDRHGHAAGDECLKQVAAVIRRFDPDAVRMGGEEFLVTVDNGSAVEQLAESIRSAIEAEVRRPCGAPITVSVGAVNVDEGAASASPQQAIRCADKLLYESKTAGRNRVTASDISTMHLGGRRRIRDRD